MGCSESSAFLKLAVIIKPVGLFFIIIGIATSHWSTSTSSSLVSSHFGLWEYCVSFLGTSTCIKYTESTITVDDWVKACQAFGILSVLTLAAAIVTTFLCIIVLTKEKFKIAFILALVLTLTGAAFIFLAVIIWGAKSSDLSIFAPKGVSVGWSLVISVIGGIFNLVGGALIAVDIFKM